MKYHNKYIFLIISFTFIFQFLYSEDKSPQSIGPDSTVININNWELWVRSDGSIPPIGKNGAGGSYPQEVNAIYYDGISFGGKVNDGSKPNLRVIGNNYVSGLKAGKVLYESGVVTGSEESSEQQIWRIRRDYKTVDLRKDAASTLMKEENQINSTDIQKVYDQYDHDWQNWPADKGAPFVDNNINGTYEPDKDIPGTPNALQTIWLVANDLPYSDGTDISTKSFGSSPIGIELQMTVWAALEPTEIAMEHTIFKEIKIIYTGTPETPKMAKIDTMYFTNFVDGDLGVYIDDFAGYDSALNMGYFYNGKAVDDAYAEYGLNPPAVGYSFLELPKENEADVPMSSFIEGEGGHNSPNIGEYSGSVHMFNIMEGYRPFPPQRLPFIDPITQENTKFMLNGDPVTGTGYIDGILSGPGDKMFWMTCGPFSMALGDTQRAVMAIVGGSGGNYLTNITIMKFNAEKLRFAWTLDAEEELSAPKEFSLSQNYPNPFNPMTSIRYDLPETGNVEIIVYNILGEKITTLIYGTQQAGAKEVVWNGTDDLGGAVSAGIYIYQIRAGDFVESRKMILIR